LYYKNEGFYLEGVSDCEEYGVLRSQSAALDALGVKCIYLDNSGPEILLLFLKAP
jgi:hypothetical protein